MFEKTTYEFGWHDKSLVDTYPMSSPCVVIVVIIIGPINCGIPYFILTPHCPCCHDDPSCWVANGWGELHTTKVIVELGFASEAGSCICWVTIVPCGHNVTYGGTCTWLGGHVVYIAGNDYVYTLAVIATFVGQNTYGYPSGIYGNAPDATIATLGGQPRFIS